MRSVQLPFFITEHCLATHAAEENNALTLLAGYMRGVAFYRYYSGHDAEAAAHNCAANSSDAFRRFGSE